jgi:hypothetical protein
MMKMDINVQNESKYVNRGIHIKKMGNHLVSDR